MMAAEHHFIYSGGGPVDANATHVGIHESITVIPAYLFCEHPNIIELICHAGVKRIERFAFTECPRLRRLIIPGVEVVEESAFDGCKAVTDIDCDNMERIDMGAFHRCKSVSSINLPSAKEVGDGAWGNCEALTEVKFGKNLESVVWGAFENCPSLERITIPLKNVLFTDDNIFRGCGNLKSVDLVEQESLHETIDALLLEVWRNDMKEELNSINQSLPNANAGENGDEDDVGMKTEMIRDWIARVLHKITRYKSQHRGLLNEAAVALQLVLPKDIVMNNVLPFLDLPSYMFEEGNGEEVTNDDDSGDSDY